MTSARRLRMLSAFVLVALLALLASAWALLRTRDSPERAATPAAAPVLRATARADHDRPLHYLAFGGGSFPDSTEVSLEQSLQLFARVVAGPGRVLFAGGSHSSSVRFDPDPHQHATEHATEAASPQRALLARLGELFDPRSARKSRYRAPAFEAQPATLENVQRSLEHALSQRGARPLLVYVAAHGERGETPRDGSIVLWGNAALTVEQLARLHDRHPRPLRAVITTCFSGGFAELAFANADAGAGSARAPRCGLFSGTWDRETSGCDPNPDRRAQESYSLHFLHALAGQDDRGAPLPQTELDFDGDGHVSLLEAHTRARVAARSIDVPTSTSERYLREVTSERGTPSLERMPEDAHVVDQLGRLLGLRDADAARRRADALRQRLETLANRTAELEAALDAAYYALLARLLARWPVLDDPYHPEHPTVLANAGAEINRALDHWPEAKAHARAQSALAAIDDEAIKLELESASVERLARAHDTLELESALHARGGPELAHYQALLACERDVPELSASRAPPGDAQ